MKTKDVSKGPTFICNKGRQQKLCLLPVFFPGQIWQPKLLLVLPFTTWSWHLFMSPSPKKKPTPNKLQVLFWNCQYVGAERTCICKLGTWHARWKTTTKRLCFKAQFHLSLAHPLHIWLLFPITHADIFIGGGREKLSAPRKPLSSASVVPEVPSGWLVPP